MTVTKATVVSGGLEVSSGADPTTAVLQRLASNKAAWARKPLTEKIALIDVLRLRALDYARAVGVAALPADGRQGDQSAEGLNTVVFSLIDGYLWRLRSAYDALVGTGPDPKFKTRTTADGQTVVELFPSVHPWDRKLFAGAGRTDLYILPGKDASRGAELVGDGRHGGKLCFILGAGNRAFLAVTDLLSLLFEHNCVVALKPHPRCVAYQRALDIMLAPLHDAGVLASLYLDSVEATQHAIYHPLVDAVHMTGGTATHDAIVWGVGDEAVRRRAANDPKLKVPITSELGCVSPWLLAPAAFSDAELTSYAAQVVESAVMFNGCQCLAAKVLLLPGDWAQGDALVAKIREVLAARPSEPPCYPGVRERLAAFKAAYPGAEEIIPASKVGSDDFGAHLPYLLNVLEREPELPESEYAFRVEPFAPALTVVKLNTTGVEEYLQRAVELSNTHLWGNLSCSIHVHPSLRETHEEAVQRALDSLRYGTVVRNGSAFQTFAGGMWGAFQGANTLADIQSGIGVVLNPWLFDHPQKVVFTMPWEHDSVPRATKPLQLPPMWVLKLLMGANAYGLSGLYRAWRMKDSV